MNATLSQRHQRILSEARAMRPSGQALFRAATAAAIAQASPGARHDQELRGRYGDDAAAALVLRAAVSPASLQDDEWAAVLGGTAVADFIGGLGPMSAAAQLIAGSLRVDLAQRASVLVPTMTPSASGAGFVAEGQLISATASALGGPTITPSKVALMVVATAETLRSAAAEPIFRALITESAALALYAAMFSTATAVAGERPAGLLNGVTPITSAAGGGDEAMIADLGALASAVAPIAAGNMVLVGSPSLAMKLAMRRVSLPVPVFASGALAEGTIVAVAPPALVTAVDPVPSIETSREAVIHTASPASHIADEGGSVTAPTRSMFQIDAVATRLILGASWSLRTSGAVAYVMDATW